VATAWFIVDFTVTLPDFHGRFVPGIFSTWQELASAAPATLQTFLARKYGIGGDF
jgi:hypothetical protein